MNASHMVDMSRERTWSRLGTQDAGDIQVSDQEEATLGSESNHSDHTYACSANAVAQPNDQAIISHGSQNVTCATSSTTQIPRVQPASSFGSDGIFPAGNEENELNEIRNEIHLIKGTMSDGQVRVEQMEKSMKNIEGMEKSMHDNITQSTTYICDQFATYVNAANRASKMQANMPAAQGVQTRQKDCTQNPAPKPNRQPRSKETKSRGAPNTVPMIINRVHVIGEVDAGAASSKISRKMYKSIPKAKRPTLKTAHVQLWSPNGEQIEVFGRATFNVRISGKRKSVKLIVADIPKQCILGDDMMEDLGESIAPYLTSPDIQAETDLSSSDSTSETDQSSDSETSEDDSTVLIKAVKAKRKTTSVKLSNFDGTEKWPTYKNKFETIAKRQGWTESDKLDQLLPRIQGPASEFVFNQLPQSTLKSYKKLIGELDSRYRVVEIPKNFQNKFDRRDQQPYESYEDYAVELKRLYDKAYSTRPTEIREQDLVKRFMNGVRDGKARRIVDFVKHPKSIDDAVVEVINYVESAGKRNDESVAKVQFSHVNDSSSDDEQINRLPEAPKPKQTNKPQAPATAGPDTESTAQVFETGILNAMTNALSTLEQQGRFGGNSNNGNRQNFQNNQYRGQGNQNYQGNSNRNQGYQGNSNRNQGYQGNQYRGQGNQNYQGNPRQADPRTCFNCQQTGHIANMCPLPRQNNGGSQNNQTSNNAPANQAGQQQAAAHATQQFHQGGQATTPSTAVQNGASN